MVEYRITNWLVWFQCKYHETKQKNWSQCGTPTMKENFDSISVYWAVITGWQCLLIKQWHTGSIAEAWSHMCLMGERSRKQLAMLRHHSSVAESGPWQESKYNHTEWTHVFMDGYTEEATRNEGADIFIIFPDGKTSRQAQPTGRYLSNYR